MCFILKLGYWSNVIKTTQFISTVIGLLGKPYKHDAIYILPTLGYSSDVIELDHLYLTVSTLDYLSNCMKTAPFTMYVLPTDDYAYKVKIK